MSQGTFKTYSRDDEIYCFNSIGELLDDLDSDGELVAGQTYYEADCRKIVASDFTGKRRVESILEQWDHDLYEDVGEISDNDFSNSTDEAKDELATLLAGWIEKHAKVDRYWKIIGKTREMKVEPDDIKEGGAV